MISLHFPPIAARAAVSGHPVTGFGRRARRELPERAFWMELMAQIIFVTEADRRPAMIVEVRSYRIKPGRRAEFVHLFETRAVPAQRKLGIKIIGPMLDIENPNKFVFLRSFPSLEERDHMKAALYEGDLWKNELEGIVIPMIDSYDVILCETSVGYSES
jgi:hypothetical protein